ncbi:MAG: hypothetical protein WA952_20830, partial [Lewinella sp.]
MDEPTFAVVGYPQSHNLGDEVQSIAAGRLLPRVDVRVPREGMDTFQSAADRIHLLCNGFFMYAPEHWPPGDNIDPLFVSLHVSTETGAAKYLLRPDLKSYYQRYAPVGCRDRQTAAGFKKLGVDAYFSGCVTLTLQNPYGSEERNDEIVLADPFYKFLNEDYRDYLAGEMIPPEHRHR